MTKLTDVKPGDILEVDGGFTCMKSGNKLVYRDPRPGPGREPLYVECNDGGGRHYLDGQLDRYGNLVGMKKVVPIHVD